MKKILLLSLLAFAFFTSFSSCENEEISVNDIPYPIQVFPEPYTVWGGAVSDVINFMKPFGLSNTDTEPGNATCADGPIETKFYKIYIGNNPYDSYNSKITYNYCFDNKEGSLKAVRVELVGHSQFKLDEVSIQFKNSGYHYDGLINSQYYLFSNDNTTIKCYLAKHSFVFAKKGDPNEIVWE